MEKKLSYFSETDRCPIRNVLDRLGDKWSMLVVLLLNEEEKMRFGELHKTISDISQKMLTVTLRTLEADGLISRKVYPEIPPKVEYQLTEMGRSLVPHLAGLSQWAKMHMPTIVESRAKYTK